MIKHIAQQNDRLDSITYKYYGSLDALTKIISINSELEPLLKAGDIVLIPKKIKTMPRSNSLW